MKKISAEKASEGVFVSINCPELFRAPSFVAWLNKTRDRGTATWHLGGKPMEFSDVFGIYDGGEGDLSPANGPDGMPAFAWKKIDALMRELGINYCCFRLVNCE